MVESVPNNPPIKGNPFTQVPIEINVSVGKARPLIQNLLSLENGSVLQLDRKIDDPVELYVGDKLIAKGELQEVSDGPGSQLAVRLTEVIDIQNGI